MIAKPKRTVRSRRLRLGLTIVTASLAVVTIVSSILGIDYQRRITEASRYNRTFDFTQTTVELLRLQNALNELDSGGSLRSIQFRFEVLRNRLHIWSSGSAIGADDDLEQSPYESDKTKRLLQDLNDHLAPLIEKLPDPAVAHDASQVIAPYVTQLIQLGSLSHAHTGDTVARNQDVLRWIYAAICTVTIGLVFFGAALLLFIGRQNRHLNEIARTDALTGVANRHAFHQSLTAEVETESAIALVDVDHFKTLNDTLGHTAGDRLLVLLSQRFSRYVDKSDLLARIGGDEFALLFAGPGSTRRATEATSSILAAMDAPLRIEGRDVRVSVTIGLSSVANGRAASLYKQADIALYEAKKAGRGQCLTFATGMKDNLIRKRQLGEDLYGATGRGEMHLAFQPLVDLDTKRTHGFEALLRWTHPQFGPVSPAEFIPIAEDGGQIVSIGRWVVDEALHQASQWPKHILVALNASARQLMDVGFPDHVNDCLRRYGVGASRLEIEITETTLIENDETALSVLHRLRAMGCRISLDDFGTGYASLSYLRRFPFDKVKIDQSFLRGSSTDDIAIIQGICDLAARLDLDIVAEGIETDAHCRMVREAGCGFGQGYLFDRPLMPDAVSKRLFDEEVILPVLQAPSLVMASAEPAVPA